MSFTRLIAARAECHCTQLGAQLFIAEALAIYVNRTAWEPGVYYLGGTLAWHGDVLYQAIDDHEAEREFAPRHWTPVLTAPAN